MTDERVHTERFLSVMLARFGDRLAVRWSVDDAARVAQVPRFTLQLLVENAIRHNQDAAAARDRDLGAPRQRPRRDRARRQRPRVRRVALAHGDAVAELDDGSSVVVSRTHRESFLIRWRDR